MESSRPNSFKQIYDPIRKIWVLADPEEIVRQTLIQKMIHCLGFPAELLAVEVDLNSLSHITTKAPDRRADLICFAKGIHPSYPLYPLLLIECKRGKASKKALDQLIGYNYFVKAPFIAVADSEEIITKSCTRQDSPDRRFIPMYQDLLLEAMHS